MEKIKAKTTTFKSNLMRVLLFILFLFKKIFTKY